MAERRMTGSITLKRAAQPGKDGTHYEIIVSLNTLKYEDNDVVGKVGGNVYMVKGDSRTLITDSELTMYFAANEEYTWTATIPGDGYFEADIGDSDHNESPTLIIQYLTGGTVLASATVPISIPGTDGKQGLQGCVMRRSEWVIGQQYLNEEEVKEDRVRYIDVVGVRAKAAATGWRFYRCKVSHTSSADTAPTSDTTHWEEMSNVGPIYTSLLLADDAKITFLSGNQIAIQKDDGTVTAGMSGAGTGTGGIRFWAGADKPSEAPFRVDETGMLTASNAEISGIITCTQLKFVETENEPNKPFLGSIISVDDYIMPKLDIGEMVEMKVFGYFATRTIIYTHLTGEDNTVRFMDNTISQIDAAVLKAKLIAQSGTLIGFGINYMGTTPMTIWRYNGEFV